MRGSSRAVVVMMMVMMTMVELDWEKTEVSGRLLPVRRCEDEPLPQTTQLN